MSASALLLSAGANQQLVASKLETGPEKGTPTLAAEPGDAAPNTSDDENGVLEIDHAQGDENTPPPAAPTPEPAPPQQPQPPESQAPQPTPPPPEPAAPPETPSSSLSPGAKMITEPPTLGGTLTANSQAEHFDPVTDPLSMPASDQDQLMDRKEDTGELPAVAEPPAVPPAAQPAASLHMTPAPPSWTPPPSPTVVTPTATDGKDMSNETLSDLEKSVGSPHATSAELENVRDEVSEALSGTESNEPIKALNAQPLGDDLHPAAAGPTVIAPTPADSLAPSVQGQPDDDSGAPPPVPPPIPFQFGNPPPPKQ